MEETPQMPVAGVDEPHGGDPTTGPRRRCGAAAGPREPAQKDRMGTVRTFRLSKSRITAGLQCGKRLWLAIHRPELEVYGADTQRRFAAGHDVGEVARELYGGGELIDEDVTAQPGAARDRGGAGAARRPDALRSDLPPRGRPRPLPTCSSAATAATAWSRSSRPRASRSTTCRTSPSRRGWPRAPACRSTCSAWPSSTPTTSIPAGTTTPGCSRRSRWPTRRARSWRTSQAGCAASTRCSAARCRRSTPGTQCRRPFDCPFIPFCEEQEGVVRCAPGEEPDAGGRCAPPGPRP